MLPLRQQRALHQECRADGTDPTRLNYLLAGNLPPLFAGEDLGEVWRYFRHKGDYSAAYRNAKSFRWCTEQAEHFTDPDTLPATLAEFEQQLRAAFAAAGFEAPA